MPGLQANFLWSQWLRLFRYNFIPPCLSGSVPWTSLIRVLSIMSG